MILDDEEIQERLESPLNLLNRLRKVTTSIPTLAPAPPKNHTPTSSELIDNIDDKIAEALSRTKATSIMNKAMNELEARIPDVQKAETLSRIASDMSKIVSSQSGASSGKGHTSQIIVYAPQIQTIDAFEVIDIKEQ